MGRLISQVIRWGVNKFLIFLFVLVLLVSFQLLKEQYIDYDDNSDQVTALEKEIRLQETKIEELEMGLPVVVQKKLDSLDKKVRWITIELAGLYNQIKVYRKEFPIQSRNPLSKVYREIYKIEHFEIPARNGILAVEYKVREQITGRHDQKINELVIELEGKKLEREQLINEQEGNFLAWVFKKFNQHMYSALYIVVTLILFPVLIKVLFYFVLAPWATKCRPIQILGDPDSSDESVFSGERGNISSTSLEIKLLKDEELHVLAEYLQPPDPGLEISHTFLLNKASPLSSIASGMYWLTRIVSGNQTSIVLTSSKLPFIDLGIIELNENVAVVCFPRSLVGIINNRLHKVKITKHWRLNSLHGWLTLQLRYLVFHGPCRLVVKGCRGVRVEDAREGRTINQAATLGFSANLNYKNARCETFYSYWTGAKDLLNDHFDGEHGFVFFEEMPDLDRKTGLTGRGLEGFTDSCLKTFGI
jgi:hypothetical protein